MAVGDSCHLETGDMEHGASGFFFFFLSLPSFAI